MYRSKSTTLSLIVEFFRFVINDYILSNLFLISICFVYITVVLLVLYSDNGIRRKFSSYWNNLREWNKPCSHKKVTKLIPHPFEKCNDCSGPINGPYAFYDKCIKCGGCWHSMSGECETHRRRVQSHTKTINDKN